MKLILLSFVVILFLPLIVFAAFDDVSLTGTTLQVTVGGNGLDLTVANGTLEQLVVNSGNLEVTLSAGSSVNLTSADRRTFTYSVTNAIGVFDCTSSNSVLTLSLSQGLATETVLVTPSSSGTCTIPGTSGGGGGGSTTTTTTTTTTTAATTDTTTTTTTAVAETVVPEPFGAEPGGASEQLTPPPSVPAPSPIAAAVSPVFATGLSLGQSDADIKRLQQVLNSDPDTRIAESGVGSPGNETNFFGSLTERAVQKFQLKYGVVTSSSDAGYGYVGPKTRAKLQEVFSGIPAAPAAEASSVEDALNTKILEVQKLIKDLQAQIKAAQ